LAQTTNVNRSAKLDRNASTEDVKGLGGEKITRHSGDVTGQINHNKGWKSNQPRNGNGAVSTDRIGKGLKENGFIPFEREGGKYPGGLYSP